MSFWKNLFKRKKEKNETKEIKRPRNSYDIYNQNETLTLQMEMDKDLIAYEENENKELEKTIDFEINNGNNDIINQTIDNNEKKLRTNTSTTKIKRTNLKNNSKNLINYFIYKKNDDSGKLIGWQVKKENATRPSKMCKTKEQTIEFVKSKAINGHSTSYTVQNKDGSFGKTMIFEAKDNKKK